MAGYLANLIHSIRSKLTGQKPLLDDETQDPYGKTYSAVNADRTMSKFRTHFKEPDASLPETSSPAVPWKSTQLARLPAELRIRIWELVLPDGNIYPDERRTGPLVRSATSDRKRYTQLALSLTCRAIYNETIDLVYANTTVCFGFDSSGNKQRLTRLQEIWPQGFLAAIQRLEIAFHLVKGYTQYYDSHPQA